MSLKSWVTEIPKKEIVVPLSYYYSSESETSCKPSVTTKERRKEELISWWLFSSSSNSKLVLQISPTSSLKTCQNQNFAAFSVSVSLSLSLCEVSGNFPTNNKLYKSLRSISSLSFVLLFQVEFQSAAHHVWENVLDLWEQVCWLTQLTLMGFGSCCLEKFCRWAASGGSLDFQTSCFSSRSTSRRGGTKKLHN